MRIKRIEVPSLARAASTVPSTSTSAPPRTHVATLHLRSHTTSLPQLSHFADFACQSALALRLTPSLATLPTKTSLYTTPRSPFAHKKSQENFWKKEHKRCIKVFDGTSEQVGVWENFLRKNARGGVGMKMQRFEYREPGWGKELIKVDDGVDVEVVARRQAEKEEVEKVAASLVMEIEEEMVATAGEEKKV